MTDRLKEFCGKYYSRTPDGIRLHDIATGDPIEPGIPASSALKDDCLREGLEYLSHLGERGGVVDLVLGPHGSTEQFRDIQDTRRQHGARLLDSRAVGVEIQWRAEVDRPTLQDVKLQPAKNGGLADFQAAELAYLESIGKPILPCDIRKGSEIHQAKAEAWPLFAGDPRLEDLKPAEREQIRLVSFAAIQATRQWMILGNLGFLASGLDAELSADSSLALILGAGHASSEQRLRDYCGIDVRTHIVEHQNAPIGPATLDYSIFYNGFIPNSQINTPLPF